MNRVEFPDLAPSVCFVCEATPNVPMADTLRSFDPGVITPLNGRKYVCANCAQEAAEVAGAFDGFKQRIADAEAEAARVAAEAKAVEDVLKAIEAFQEKYAPKPAQAEKPKKTAAPKTPDTGKKSV